MARTIVVTGAAGALGEGVVRRLVAGGARVIAIGSERSRKAVETLAAELGAGCVPLAFDVASHAAWVSALVDVEAMGPPDGAVFAAGAWAGGSSLRVRSDDTTYRQMIGANLDTAYCSLAALLPGMAERGRGSVVLVGSRAAVRPETSANAPAYAVAKAGVVALAQAAAAGAPRGVRVNVILPTTIDTPNNRRSMPDADFSSWVSIDSISSLIDFLLSDAGSDVAGAVIDIPGRA